MALLDAITEAVLREHFDPLTLHRGREYAQDGRVGAAHVITLGEGTVTASANVRGSRPAPYRVQLTAEALEGELWLTTQCSCPVRFDCKHGAALAVTLTRPQTPPPAKEWEAQLTGLLTQLAEETRDESDRAPLALDFELDTGRGRFTRHDSPVVRIRPLRGGTRQRWVKTGADWPDITGAVPGRMFARAQLRPLQELGRALQHERGFWYAGTGSPLDDFGPRVVELIRAAHAAGVELVAGNDLAGVRVHDEQAELVVQARREGDGTRLEMGLDLAGAVRSGPQVLLIGQPAHSAAVLVEGVLHLVRLAGPLAPQAAAMLTRAGGLGVPEADTDRLAALLGPLARLVPVRSPDDSVVVPEAPRPQAELRVTWRSSTHAELAWQWRYGARSYPLTSRDDLGTVRDAAAEKEIAATLPAELIAADELTGGDALALALHDLPALREQPDVVVVEVERPQFRAAVDDPDIRFELAEPDAGHTDWLDLEVHVAIDDEAVPLPDVLAALTRGDEFLVLPSGLYVATDRPEFARLHDIVVAAAQLREREGDALRIGKDDLGIWAQLADAGVVDRQAGEWVARARALRDLVEIPRPEPTGLTATLRPYQRDGFHWLAFLWEHGLGGILADDMGLGKTIQVLALIAHARARGSEPFLVVAPTSVVSAWTSEATRHTPGLRVATVTRRSDDVGALAAQADVVVTTYALLRLEQDQFASRSWGGLILDEAQQTKNHQSKTYGAARRIESPFRLAVTGTPFENQLMELWSLLSIAAPGLYPSPRQFRDLVVNPVERGSDPRALERFRRRIRPFLLRRTKELVADDLPPKQEQVVSVELGGRHRRIYDAHLARERQRILGLLDDFDRNRVAILAALTTLRQLSLDPALVADEHEGVGSAKVDYLVDQLLEITAEGHRALVFSQFTRYLSRVRVRLEAEGIATSYLDGSTTDRGRVIEEFRSGASPVFLISLKAGGVGLTLTEADYVFLLDPWWNPAAEAQAVDRAHRIGQQRHVNVYRLVSADTIEEKVMALKARKAELFAQVLDGDSGASTSLQAGDIRNLFDA